MPTTAEPGGGRRIALVVATGGYSDATLARLRAPGRDASRLAEVLRDDEIGGFSVETVLDAPADVLRRRIARFCAQGAPSDLALVYLSCHGVLDDRGRLYYATTDTARALLSATAIPAAWLNEQLEDCRCRRQILMLDCCHSGAFAKGAKGEGGLALRERFEGRGRVVLTGSRGTEYSFEGGEVHGDGVSSVFTGVLVDGLRSGDADRDRDRLVTVSEFYDYAYEKVRSRDGRQNPTLWTYGAEGDMLVAQSPAAPWSSRLRCRRTWSRCSRAPGRGSARAPSRSSPTWWRVPIPAARSPRVSRSSEWPRGHPERRRRLPGRRSGRRDRPRRRTPPTPLPPARLPRRQRTSPPRPRRPAAGPPAHAGHGAARPSSPPGTPGWRSSPSPSCSSPAGSRRRRRARSPSPAPRAASPSARAPCGWPGTTPTR